MEKVYCKKCFYFNNRLCRNPNNIFSNYYFDTNPNRDFPEYLNKNNDCKWYKSIKDLSYKEKIINLFRTK